MVKCSECGFLAQRLWGEGVPRGFIEVLKEPREDGNLPASSLGYFLMLPPEESRQTLQGDSYPTCFAMVTDLWHEAEELLAKDQSLGNTNIPTASYVSGVIKKQRKCPSWVKWQLGFSPKEHREMLDRETMLKWQRDESRQNRKYRLIELGLVLATIIVVLVAAFIERSGQPIINNIIQVPTPSISDRAGTQP